MRRLVLDGKQALTVTDNSFMNVLCLDGECDICFEGEIYKVQKGDSYFMPAGMGAFAADGKATLILSEV